MSSSSNSSNFSIREADYSDIRDIRRLARRAGIFRYPTIIYSLFIALSFVTIIRCGSKTQPIGYAVLFALPFLGTAFLAQIAIGKKWQQSGLGSLTYNWIVTRAKEEYDITSVAAHTLKPEAVSWFLRRGFKVVGSFWNRMWVVYKRI